MTYKRFRIQVVARVVGIVLTALGLAALVGWTRLYLAWAAAGGLLVWQIAALVRYAERWVRDLTRFLEAVRYDDFSQGFSGGGRGPFFDRLAGAFQAITEQFRRVRAEREERARYLQNVVHHVGLALVAYRAGGEVEMMNAAAKRLLQVGRLPSVQALGGAEEPLGRALQELRSGERRLVVVKRPERTLQLSVYVTRFRLGSEAHALASIQDIGDELAEKEMEAWQQLTRVLTHEITNSVAPISSLAETGHPLLENGQEPPEEQPAQAFSEETVADTREALETIRRRGQALIGFIESYRTFTHIPSPAYEMVRASGLLGRVRRLLGAQIERQGAVLHVEVDPPDFVLTADPDLVEQVLINLVLNALHAVEGQAGGRVTLRAAPGRHGRGVLRVADNGPGIPPDVQERIFVPFFTTKEEGSGIGLSLSRQIMRLHGGTLTVQSAPGEGAAFTLRF